MTQLVILSSLLIGVFDFPADLVLYVMVPGTAAGVLLGDLAYTGLARALMRRTGPRRRYRHAVRHRHAVAVRHGVRRAGPGQAGHRRCRPGLEDRHGASPSPWAPFKLALAFAGDWARRVVPRAALLGSIAGVATLLIAFLPALKVFGDPLVGLISLTVVLVTLVGRVRLPGGIPGAFAAVLAGTLVFWGRALLGGAGATALLAAPLAGLRPAMPWPTPRVDRARSTTWAPIWRWPCPSRWPP